MKKRIERREITIGKEYIMNPPFEKNVVTKGKRTKVIEKADEDMKANIEALFPHHANGMDWYKTTDRQWGREDWFKEV